MSDFPDNAAPAVSPILPVQLGLDDKFQFRCRKGIACFNKCCENIDILLTPYDIVRLKNRLGITSREFIDAYTTDFAMDGQGTPGLKLATKPGSAACINLTPEGCGVYEDRPAACRYYALGLASMRKKDSPTDEDSYFMVKEEHCLGHQEPVVQTVRDYRRDQGVDVYDEINREWRQIILKKRSSGPTVGKPSERSFELFFLASYDSDSFRDFIASAGFGEVFELDSPFRQELLQDDVKLLKFAFRLLKQVLFGERTIPLRPDAAQKRSARYRERLAQRSAGRADDLADAQDKIYESLGD
ncbi:MAG: YkgJ family cysteine cluster protein [Betaproteobacteria bacterium]|nr:MAG: YkgJ family cysteine cluster protein [Betaproteobacteria bacterium]